MKVQHLFMSGCSTLTRQTVAYSTAEHKFAYAGDAHIYVFDCREGAYRLESTIPFCEKASMTEEGKEESKTNSVLHAHESFGGAGVTCLDFSTTNTKLLAAVTMKTRYLEIWDTQAATLHKIYSVKDRILQVSWSTTNTR